MAKDRMDLTAFVGKLLEAVAAANRLDAFDNPVGRPRDDADRTDDGLDGARQAPATTQGRHRAA